MPEFRGLCSKCGDKVMSDQERMMDTSTKQYYHADCSAEKEKAERAAEEKEMVNAQAEGGQSLKSEELDALAKILKIAGRLSRYGVTIDPPKIAVVGGQSAGKSTLFNVILREVGSYARFPSGRGTCTKVPTILTLAKSGYPYVKVDGNEIKMDGLSDMDKSERVIQAILNAQRRILEGQFPGYTDDKVVFSATPVNVVAGAPRVSTEIVIVDLPGLVQRWVLVLALVLGLPNRALCSVCFLLVLILLAAQGLIHDDSPLAFSDTFSPFHAAPTPILKM